MHRIGSHCNSILAAGTSISAMTIPAEQLVLQRTFELAMFLAVVVAFSSGCGREPSIALDERVLENEVAGEGLVLDRRVCVVGKSSFTADDEAILLNRLRVAAARVKGKHVLTRLTLVPCGPNGDGRSDVGFDPGIAQLVDLADSAEARLRIDKETKNVPLGDGGALRGLRLGGHHFVLFTFHIYRVHGVSRLDVDLRTDDLPSLAVARDITNMIGSYFYGPIGSYFSNLRISVEIHDRVDGWSRGPYEKGNLFPEVKSAPYLVCSYDPRTDPTDCGVVEALPIE